MGPYLYLREDTGPRSLKMGILINGLARHDGPEDLAFSCG